jgi:cysteine desulfurase/selenocysteine lyase
VKTADALDVKALREEYPALENKFEGKRLVYLDSACTALKPRCVADRLRDFYLNWGGCGGKRSTHLLSQQVEAWFQDARREAAAFVNAEKADEIVFTSGTTDAVNLVARAFPYTADRNEVVVTDLEHNSVVLPFKEAEARGLAKVRFCPVGEEGLDLARMEELVSKKTALVALARSSNVLGGSLPVDRVAKIARANGAKILVDDAQYLSSHREDVQASNVDFAAFSAHKLGGPFGVGVLYGKEHLLNGLGHHRVGGGTVKDYEVGAGADDVEPVYLDAPMRFEAGVQDFPGAAAFGDALRLLRSLDAAAVRAHVAGLVDYAYERLSTFDEIKILGNRESLLEGSLLSFYPVHPEFSAKDFNIYLNHELMDKFIAVRIGDHCAHVLHKRLRLDGTIRLSFFAYNLKEEVDVFIEALEVYINEACR